MNNGQANRLLGYPADARLLILNADDFGMCNSTNEAIMRTLAEGVVHSTTLMVPCPWAPQAMRFLAAHPEIPFGIRPVPQSRLVRSGSSTRWLRNWRGAIRLRRGLIAASPRTLFLERIVGVRVPNAEALG